MKRVKPSVLFGTNLCRSLLAVILAVLMPAAPARASGPGFDCAKATRQIDKAICDWDTVGTLDGRMAAAYKKALAAVRANQRAWLAGRDRRCALNHVKPRQGSEEGLDPLKFGQLICLQTAYPARIAQLMNIVAPPLAPSEVKAVPIEPLRTAYPDEWRQAGYQAQFSPDKTLMALGVEDSAGYVRQVWLYQPASGLLVVASPSTHEGRKEKPEDISELSPWVWGRDGRFYLRAIRPLGHNTIFGADMEGYAESRNLPPDVAGKLAAYDAARTAHSGTTPERSGPPGFDDNSYDEQDGGTFIAWAQNKGHGSFDLMVARDGEDEPRIIASGGWELRDFLLDPSGRRLFYNGEDGLVVTNPDTRVTRRLKGTRGVPSEIRPINLSADGEILTYSASDACTRDAADEIDPDADDDGSKRVCLAYLQTVDGAPVTGIITEPVSGQDAARTDQWAGKWQGGGEGNLSAIIRHGTAKPDYLVIDLYTAAQGCSGMVTLYGKPKGVTVLGESFDPGEPAAPVCRVAFSLDYKGVLKAEVAGPCTHYHGGGCGFDGTMTRVEAESPAKQM